MVTLPRFHCKTQKLTTPCTAWWTMSQESTAQWLSFEWSHVRIWSTDSKVRTTLYSIINSTTGKYCSVAEWSHLIVSSTDSKVRTSLYCIHQGTVYYVVQGGSNLWVCKWNPKVSPFKWKLLNRLGFQVHTFISWNYLVEHYKQYHSKIMYSRFIWMVTSSDFIARLKIWNHI